MLLLLLAVRKQPLHRVLAYAWNPTVVLSFAMSGHRGSLAILTPLVAILLIIGGRTALSIAFLALEYLPAYTWLAVWGWKTQRARAARVPGSRN